ncbi:hypothetical protein ACS5PN_22365 [Roseateles sp. NT4]|uniref:hypothetical protein n=1 Tax=Roseateles sp. NT4 TaxID=3453715 RepID=UPI003EEE6FE0
MKLRLFTAALLAAMVSFAQASGAGPTDMFVQRDMPDVAADAWLHGQLGMLLPSYPRVHLIPAWRALASADAGRPLQPISEEAWRLACCDGGALQVAMDGPATPGIKAWLEARSQAGQPAPRAAPQPIKPLDKNDWDGFLNCPDPAFAFATQTLARLRQRNDATPDRLRAWVQAQDQVFEHCRPDGSVLQRPEALAAREPLFWRQARDYQRAAAAFYAADWPAAGAGFEPIARDDTHPWQAWAALALLRTQLREAALSDKLRPEPAAEAEALLRRLQAGADRLAPIAARNPEAAPALRGARELIALAQAKLKPVPRLAALGAELRLLDRAPGRQTLADWVRLADARYDGKAELRQREQAADPLLDWASTLQACEAEATIRATALQHALAEWRRAPKAALWLVPALSCADGAKTARADVDALLLAGARVADGHPASATLRWQQLRLLRESGQPEAARALLPRAAALAKASAGAHNLVAQQGLALARNLDEATPWLARAWSGWRDPDTRAQGPAESVKFALAADSAAYIATRLTLAQWQGLVEGKALPAPLRLTLAGALWWRAEFIGQADRARAAAQLMQTLDRRHAPAVQPYLAARSAEARRDAIWRAGLRHDLSAKLYSGSGNDEDSGNRPETVKPEDAVAGAWCTLAEAEHDGLGDAEVERAPPLPPAEASPELAAERTALAAQGTATGAYARWVQEVARRQPAPADLDWLLYVGVQSTRGGCVDADNGTRSKAMHALLHKRFPQSPWAAKSPYWYR